MNFDLNNYEDHILDFLEGELSAEEIQAYQNWKAGHPHLQAEEDLMRQTFLTPEPMTYSNKAALKSFANQPEKVVRPKVVPLYRKYWSLGLAAAAALTFFLWTNVNDNFVQPNADSIVTTPEVRPQNADETLVDKTDIVEEIPASIETPESTSEPDLKQQGLGASMNNELLAGLNKIGDKIKEAAKNKDEAAPASKPRKANKTIRSKRPERFTKEDIDLDRRFNSTIVEAPKVKKPRNEFVDESKNLAELKQELTKASPESEEAEIMEDIIVAKVETPSVAAEDTPAKEAPEATDNPATKDAIVDVTPEMANPADEKVLQGWQKVRNTLQDKNSVLGYAAREAAEYITPTILEKENDRKKGTITVNIDFAETTLGKRLKKLRKK